MVNNNKRFYLELGTAIRSIELLEVTNQRLETIQVNTCDFPDYSPRDIKFALEFMERRLKIMFNRAKERAIEKCDSRAELGVAIAFTLYFAEYQKTVKLLNKGLYSYNPYNLIYLETFKDIFKTGLASTKLEMDWISNDFLLLLSFSPSSISTATDF